MINGYTDAEYLFLESEKERPYLPGGEKYEEARRAYLRRRGFARNAVGFTSSPEFRRLNRNRRRALLRLEKRVTLDRLMAFFAGDTQYITSQIVAEPPTPFYLGGSAPLNEFRSQMASMIRNANVIAVFDDDFDSDISWGRRAFVSDAGVSSAQYEYNRSAKKQQARDGDSFFPEIRVDLLSDGMNSIVYSRYRRTGDFSE